MKIKSLIASGLAITGSWLGLVRPALAHPHITVTIHDHTQGADVSVFLGEDYHPILIEEPTLPRSIGGNQGRATIQSVAVRPVGLYVVLDTALTQRRATAFTHNAKNLINFCFQGYESYIPGTVIGDVEIWQGTGSPSQRISGIGYISRCPVLGLGRLN